MILGHHSPKTILWCCKFIVLCLTCPLCQRSW